MDKIISATILLVIAYVILNDLVPVLMAPWEMIVSILVVLASIAGLMKIGNIWF